MEFFMGKNTVTLECISLEASALMATSPHKEERKKEKRKKERVHQQQRKGMCIRAVGPVCTVALKLVQLKVLSYSSGCGNVTTSNT